MTRMLQHSTSHPARLRFWRKGRLAFIAACLTLWLAMWAASQSYQRRMESATHSYAVDGAAWQGITRIDLRALEDSGKIVLTPSAQLRIETAWDEPAQPRLQLQRQGDTLVLRPQPGRDKQDHYRSLRVSKIFLPASILSIQGQDLNLEFAAPQAGYAPVLRIEARTLDIRGGVRQLQVQLQAPSQRPGTQQADACAREPDPRTRLDANLQAAEQLDIHAPDGSRIELEVAAEHLGQVGAIRLHTGEHSRLDLGSLALWKKVQLLPLPAAAQADCPSNASTTAEAEGDYSD